LRTVRANVNTRKKFGCLMIGMGVLSFVQLAGASVVNFLPDQNGTAVSVNSISPTMTGADMVGMLVTVNFSDSTFQTVAWGATCGAACGQAAGAIGNGTWSLKVTGDTGAVNDIANPDGTALTPWTLTTSSSTVAITSVTLNGVPGSTVFDRDRATATGTPSGGQEGTPGSSFGIDYGFASETGKNSPFTVNVRYSNIVALAGGSQTCLGSAFAANNTATGCGDVWAQLSFTFAAGSFAATGNGNQPASWSFFQDTDRGSAVPEPFSAGLMGAGLLAFAAYAASRYSPKTARKRSEISPTVA
jgi:hypothetical protein